MIKANLSHKIYDDYNTRILELECKINYLKDLGQDENSTFTHEPIISSNNHNHEIEDVEVKLKNAEMNNFHILGSMISSEADLLKFIKENRRGRPLENPRLVY